MARLSDGSNPNWFQQARHLSLESTLKFLRFFCGQLLGGPLQADFFEKRGGWGRRAHIASRAERGELKRSPTLKKGSNLRINRAHLEIGSRLARRGGGRDEQIERCDRQKFEPI